MLGQLCCQRSTLPAEVKGVYEELLPMRKTPDLRELVDAIVSVSQHFSRVWLFFDALDECDEVTQCVDILSTIQRFMKANIGGLATSRLHLSDI